MVFRFDRRLGKIEEGVEGSALRFRRTEAVGGSFQCLRGSLAKGDVGRRRPERVGPLQLRLDIFIGAP